MKIHTIGLKGHDTEFMSRLAEENGWTVRRIKIDEAIVVSDLAKRMGVKATEGLVKLMEMGGGSIHINSMLDAEMAKIMENTYRAVNIALVNEMSVFCHELGIDLWEAIRAAETKPFGFAAFRPGPGVGGHCIPIDPNYLSHQVRTLGYQFRFVELAQEISNRMPAYVVARVQETLNEVSKPMRGSTVLVMGLTYKPDIADDRETPATAVIRNLRRLGSRVVAHDPFLDGFVVTFVRHKSSCASWAPVPRNLAARPGTAVRTPRYEQLQCT